MLGFSIVGLATDMDGTLLTPSSYNGLFGLRTTVENPTVDGVFPLFERRETIGPMSKYIDDLVSTYSILINNPNLTTLYNAAFEASQLRVGFISNIFDRIQLSFRNPPEVLELDSEIRSATNAFIDSLRSQGVNILNLTLDQQRLNQVFNAANSLINSRCLRSCRQSSINRYLTNRNRFPSDSPFQNYDEFYASDLLNSNSRNSLGYNTASDNQCNLDCIQDNDLIQIIRNLFIDFFNTNQTEILIFPASFNLPYNLSSIPNNQNRFNPLTILSISGFPVLNIPISYIKSSSSSPDGLPVGVLLLSRSESLLNAFRIAKLYESSRNLAKLPHTVPLIVDSNSSNQIHLRSLCQLFFINILIVFINLFAL
jgi:Asp-tRNA(Asn)/Glu-tRNA(Gln) amidotransferase A subunit family amidase